MKKLATFLVVVVMLTASSAAALPINIIDQQNLVGNLLSGNETAMGQSFTPTLTRIDAVEVVLRVFGNDSDLGYSSLRLDLFSGGYPSELSIGSSAETVITNTAAQTIHFDLLSPVDLTPGNTYAFRVTWLDGGRYGAMYDMSNPYSGGNAFSIANTQWPSYDLVFTEGLHSDSAPVPEPSTIFLLSAGLAGLARLRRKIKKA